MKRSLAKSFSKSFYAGLALFLITVAAAIFAPLITSENPNAFHLEAHFEAPSAAHPFGRDQNGADVFAQVLYGARISLLVSVTVVAICASIGLAVGSLAGYAGGKTDLAVTRFLDMVQAFPGFLLALALVAVMGPSLPNLLIAMCATSWTGYARVVRGEVLHLKNREFVTSARALGAGHVRIIARHIWPNLLGFLAVQATFGLSGVIMAESGLSFLGLGVPADTPTWGALLSNGRRFLSEAPHLSLFPGLAILGLTASFQLLGDGFRIYLDPRAND
jgi:peptide/nickel transport system permease protein